MNIKSFLNIVIVSLLMISNSSMHADNQDFASGSDEFYRGLLSVVGVKNVAAIPIIREDFGIAGAGMGPKGFSLHINEEEMTNYSLGIKEYIIMHEGAHMACNHLAKIAQLYCGLVIMQPVIQGVVAVLYNTALEKISNPRIHGFFNSKVTRITTHLLVAGLTTILPLIAMHWIWELEADHIAVKASQRAKDAIFLLEHFGNNSKDLGWLAAIRHILLKDVWHPPHSWRVAAIKRDFLV
jgi:phosphotransferase system  glucose/maltose/N-acetylglucosamine-specific IIC component